MHHRFGSNIHFSPSGSNKEFFLVVHFTSASDPLNEDSVAIALQCCIGGVPSGLNVTHLSGRRFRFSVASNKVGHFIYGLKDRVWPDFVCHFHLFNGRFASAPIDDSSWHADTEHTELSSRRSLAVKSSLQFLHSGANLNSNSEEVLCKFGLIPFSSMRFSNNAHEASSSRMNQNSPVLPSSVITTG